MVEEPVDFFEFQLAGFNMLIVHFESFRTSQQLESALKEIRVAGLKVGLAINPETPVTTLPAYAHLIDQITLLAIHPGFQGQQMLPDAQRRVAEVRRLLPRMDVEVDGGINTENATHIAAAGADFLVVGSALWEDPVRSFEDLQSSLGVASA
jgi:ribulose-phosphate 3-epimerase